MQLDCEGARMASRLSTDPGSITITFWPSEKVRDRLGITSYYQSDVRDAEPNDFLKMN
jgi:hypothetical protein